MARWLWPALGVLVVLAVACLLPFVLSNYRVFQLTLAYVYAIALFGLNLLTGYNGQISLGHGAFYALGAYTTAIMMDQWGIAYGWTIPVAGLVCLGIGVLFGIPALRLEGLYLALATFSLALAVPQLLKHFETWTGGVQGIVLPEPQVPFGLSLTKDQWLYFLTLGILVVAFVAGWNLLRGRIGRAIIAIRDHPIASLPQIRIQTAIGRKITPQRILGIALREAGHHTEPRSANSVNHTEIEAFCKGTLLRRNVFRLYVKDLRGRDRMKIGTGDKCIDELLVIRKSSEDPQFDL